MKYYLSVNGGSGIKADTKEEILKYISEELDRIDEFECIDIEIDGYCEIKEEA